MKHAYVCFLFVTCIFGSVETESIRVKLKTLRGGYDAVATSNEPDINTIKEAEAIAEIMAPQKVSLENMQPTAVAQAEYKGSQANNLGKVNLVRKRHDLGHHENGAEKLLVHAGGSIEKALECASSTLIACKEERLTHLMFLASSQIKEMSVQFRDSYIVETMTVSVLNLLDSGSTICKEERSNKCKELLDSALKMIQEISSDQIGRPWSEKDLRSFSHSILSTSKELHKLLLLYQVSDMAKILTLVKRLDADFLMLNRVKLEAGNRRMFEKNIEIAESSYEHLKHFIFTSFGKQTTVVMKLELITGIGAKVPLLKDAIVESIANAMKGHDRTAFADFQKTNITCSFYLSVPDSENSNQMTHTLQVGISVFQDFAGKAVETVKYICGRGILEKELAANGVPLHNMNLLNVQFLPVQDALNVSKVAENFELYIKKSSSNLVKELQRKIVINTVNLTKFGSSGTQFSCKNKVCPFGMECRAETCEYLKGCTMQSECKNLVNRSCFQNFCVSHPIHRALSAHQMHSVCRPLNCILSQCSRPKKKGRSV